MKWISVKEKLPDEGDWVLLTDEFGNLEDDKHYRRVRYPMTGLITHWIKLPSIKD